MNTAPSLQEVLAACISALESCYDVQSYPGDG